MVDIMTLRNETSEMLKTATSYGIDKEHGQATVHAVNAQNQILIALLEEFRAFVPISKTDLHSDVVPTKDPF